MIRELTRYLQTSEDGLEHPLCFFLRKFNVHKRAYSTIEKEALALVLALEHFGVMGLAEVFPVCVPFSLSLQGGVGVVTDRA